MIPSASGSDLLVSDGVPPAFTQIGFHGGCFRCAL